MFFFSPADAVNNPYEPSPAHKRTITGQSVSIKCMYTHMHSCTHKTTKTAPVNTRKHQLLTVTTLFLFVIQSNNNRLLLSLSSSLDLSIDTSVNICLRLQMCCPSLKRFRDKNCGLVFFFFFFSPPQLVWLKMKPPDGQMQGENEAV